jgi:hypothetical protein
MRHRAEDAMDRYRKFELRRQSDELVYTFVWTERADHPAGYKRQDGDYWITKRADWGWTAWDDGSDLCTGRPWHVLPQDQGDHPPEGLWVSQKGTKSYVYLLVYLS